MALDTGKIRDFVQKTWDQSIVPTLHEYVKIPAKSPMFDAQWREHGHIDRAVELLRGWASERPIEGLHIEVVRLEGRTPVIFMEAPGTGADTVLLYGHLDKQPEMVGWAEGTGPWTPVRRGDKLYGRGVGDDGYATFAALTAIQALQEQRARHARCVVLIEACEESGSVDLPYYVDALKAKLGTPSLVVCLDSGCGNYEQLWGTTSLRGVVGGVLTVEVLTEGVHSGAASGIVASSFRILRQLLDRIEDSRTGHIHPRDFHVEIPRERAAEAREVAKVLGTEIYDRFPFPPGGMPVSTDPYELILNNTWRPALAITGAAGLPLPIDGGNVLRPQTSLKLSLRRGPVPHHRRDGPRVERPRTERVPPLADRREGDLVRRAGHRRPLREGEMSKAGFRVLDSDLHVIEPSDLYEHYLDPAYRDRTPRPTATRGAYTSQWTVGDFTFPRPRGRGRVDAEQPAATVLKDYAAARFDSVSQLRAMDAEGLDIAVLFRTLPVVCVDAFEPRF